MTPHRAHPSHWSYPRWAATPRPSVWVERQHGFYVVAQRCHPAEWCETIESAGARNAALWAVPDERPRLTRIARYLNARILRGRDALPQ